MSESLKPSPFLAVRPYSVQFASGSATVVFKTLYAWMKWPPLFAAVVSMGSFGLALANGSPGVASGMCPLFTLSVVTWAVYLGVVQRGYRPVNIAIRSAMKDGTAEFSGGAYSFANPLTVTFPVEHGSGCFNLDGPDAS